MSQRQNLPRGLWTPGKRRVFGEIRVKAEGGRVPGPGGAGGVGVRGLVLVPVP